MTSKSSQEISENHYQSLLRYIEQLRDGGLKFPSRGGKVNKTAVATTCGFNRETFNQNARFEDRLAEAVDELGLEHRSRPELPKRDGGEKARVTQLEQQLAAVKGEVLELRRKLARYEHSTLTGRRVIP